MTREPGTIGVTVEDGTLSLAIADPATLTALDTGGGMCERASVTAAPTDEPVAVASEPPAPET